MHYRNGREAKNGDKVVRLNGGKIEAFGVLHSATPGNDYCNGNIAIVQSSNEYACMCDCLHVDDVAELLAQSGLDKRPEGTLLAHNQSHLRLPSQALSGREPHRSVHLLL